MTSEEEKNIGCELDKCGRHHNKGLIQCASELPFL